MGCLDAIRIILATINVIVNGLGFLYGIALVAQGIAGLLIFNIFQFITDDSHLFLYNAIFIIFIATGVALMIFSVAAMAGSCMACCPNNNCLKALASIILTIDLLVIVLLFLLGVGGVVAAFVYRDIISNNFNTVYNTVLNESYTLSPNETHVAVTFIQTSLGCCGVTGPSDFADYPDYPYGEELPQGCCEFLTLGCTIATAHNGTGCGTYLTQSLVEYYNILGGIGVVQVVILLLLIILEIFLIILVVSKKNDQFIRV